MKKISQFILAAGCALIMVGCSGNTTADNTQNNAPLTETTPVTQNQDTTESPAPTVEPTASEPSETDATATREPEPTNAPTKNTSKISKTSKTAQNTTNPVNSAKAPAKKTQSKNNEISLQKAKTIALSKAGLTEKDGYWDKAKRDIENGLAVFELEFISGEMEYDFEINAKNGNIMEYQKESVYD